MNVSVVSPYLCVWTVISLRASPDQARARAAIEARGARALALPGLRLAGPEDIDAARAQLRAALASEALIYTSPAAVRFAAKLSPLLARDAQRVFALGSGTAQALRAHGIDAMHPVAGAMQSEGLLALPALAQVRNSIGLITAPGGRDLFAPALRARGVALAVAHVYRRLPPYLSARRSRRLLSSRAPRALLLTSAEALQQAMAALSPPARACLRDATVIASSARLLRVAHAQGFRDAIVAAAPDTDTLLDALDAHAKRMAIR